MVGSLQLTVPSTLIRPFTSPLTVIPSELPIVKEDTEPSIVKEDTEPSIVIPPTSPVLSTVILSIANPSILVPDTYILPILFAIIEFTRSSTFIAP